MTNIQEKIKLNERNNATHMKIMKKLLIIDSKNGNDNEYDIDNDKDADNAKDNGDDKVKTVVMISTKKMIMIRINIITIIKIKIMTINFVTSLKNNTLFMEIMLKIIINIIKMITIVRHVKLTTKIPVMTEMTKRK
jgi:hypothetical protein